MNFWRDLTKEQREALIEWRHKKYLKKWKGDESCAKGDAMVELGNASFAHHADTIVWFEIKGTKRRFKIKNYHFGSWKKGKYVIKPWKGENVYTIENKTVAKSSTYILTQKPEWKLRNGNVIALSNMTEPDLMKALKIVKSKEFNIMMELSLRSDDRMMGNIKPPRKKIKKGIL